MRMGNMQSSTKLRRNPVIEGDPLSASLECFGLFDQLFTTTIHFALCSYTSDYLTKSYSPQQYNPTHGPLTISPQCAFAPNTIHHCFNFSVWWLSCFFFFEGWCFLDIAFGCGLQRALAKFESTLTGQFFGRKLFWQVKQWWA